MQGADVLRCHLDDIVLDALAPAERIVRGPGEVDCRQACPIDVGRDAATLGAVHQLDRIELGLAGVDPGRDAIAPAVEHLADALS